MAMNMNMKNPITRSMLLAIVALGLPACGPSVPANPTWQKDIYPLMVSRCIRCHNDPGSIDPLTAKLVPAWGNKVPLLGGTILVNFNYPTLPNPVPPTWMLMGASVTKGAPYIMPPPPAEKLDDWEIETIQNWVKSPH